MTFFYNLNKTLDAIREKPETTHGQLNERDMGKHNNAVTGFKAVADKAAKEYGSKAAGERVAGAQFQKMKKAGKLEEADLEEGFVDTVKQGAQAALGAIGSTMGHGSDEDMIRDLQKKAGLPQTGKVPPQQPGQPAQPGQQPVAEGEEEDKLLAAKIRKMLPAYHKRMEPEDAYQEVADALGISVERLYDVLEVNEGIVGNLVNRGKEAYNTYQANRGLDKAGAAQAAMWAGKAGATQQQVDAHYAQARASANKAQANRYNRTGSTLSKNSNYGMDTDAENQAGLRKQGLIKEKMNPAKAKSFAALAEPRDKITFADKIAGAKKEVDEMLGDVAAEAMKNALSGGQKKLDKNMNGKLDSEDFAMLRKGGKKQVADEGFPTVAGARAEMNKRKVGDVTHGAKHDTEETPTGRRVTRRTDPNTGYSVGSETDDEGNAKSTEKKGRGRPKKADRAPERVTAKAYKHKGGRKEKVEEGPDEGSDLVKLSKVIQSCKTPEQLKAAQRMAQSFLAKHNSGGFSNMKQDIGRLRDVDATLAGKRKEMGVDERKLSSSEKSEREDIVKGMKKNKAGFEKDYGKDAKSVMYATATKMAKERGPGNPDRKKKEKTEETTTAGSVAPAAGGKSKGGSMIGKGIYDSVNREVEAMISEGMNVSVSMNSDEHGEPRKSITISADGEAAEQLAQLLNLAGMQGQDMGSDEGCGCETSPCSCEELDENQPDWPTDQETIGNDDPLMRRYAGGVNGPKSTGQTTGAPYNSQPQRQGVMGENKDLGMKLYAELKSFKG